MARSAVKIFPSANELCRYLKMQIPGEPHSKSIWIEISDEDSGIASSTGTFSHPFVFFLSDGPHELEGFDGGTCFSRTTTDIPLNAAPPKTLGVPSHRGRACHCGFITRDAWVDFRFCIPSSGSRLSATLQFADSPSKAAEMAAGLGGDLKECRQESLDIQNQLWIAFRKDRGIL